MSIKNEQAYLNLLELVLNESSEKEDRTNTGTLSYFGAQMRFNLQDGFPLITTKKVHLKSIIHEVIWFLSGNTNVKYLQNNKVKIWDEWSTKEQCNNFLRSEGELGPIYGHQWRNFGATENGKDYYNDGFDQISWVINEIKTNPNSRRLIVTGWNPKEVNKVTLPPCHTMFQFFVSNGQLSCQLYQRSADLFLGVPFNIASYALLTHMIAHICGLEVGEFIWTGGDCHIYKNHIDQVKLQLSRKPYELPTLGMNPHIKNIFDFKYEDFWIVDYEYHPSIKAPVAI
ncbi:MAG: thymidylate synthase [Acinetobacter sp.]|uniref:thymidylate synthase n=1 Tax=Acinetobacter sp. TaxID=472 RepID=UPI0026338DEA|nr:thymidylate synthase [Acinetobacter sp.]MDD2944935.1 thymidylate synthase [Acinetobacter sp.]